MAKINVKKVKNKMKDKVLIAKKKTKSKFGGSLKTLIVILFYTLGIVVAATVLIFGLYIIITAPDFNTKQLYKKEATVLYDKDGNEITRLGNENRVLVT